MAPRDKRPATVTPSAKAAIATAPQSMEARVVAFSEQIGRILGTVQARAEGWMDRDTLKKQLAGVRDAAAGLLEQLAGDEQAAAIAKPATRGARSGGFVDAPGKKHRKPMPRDARASAASAKRSNMRSAAPSMKTMKKRGRG